MDRILEFSKTALLAIEAYSVVVDQHILAMVDHLVVGAEALAKGTAMLEKKPEQAEAVIEAMRSAYLAIQGEYREAMTAAFQEKSAMEAIKMREVVEIQGGCQYI